MSDLRKYVAGKKYTLAGSGITAIATSMVVNDFVKLDGTTITMTDIGTLGFGTIEPGTARADFITFTGITQNGDGTATITGITRTKGYAPYDTTTGQQHSGSTVFILSNTPGFYDGFTNKKDDETIDGVWDFTASPTVPTPNTATQAAPKGYIDGIAIAGSPDATTTTKGIGRVSVAPVAPTIPIFVGDNDGRVPTQAENDGLASVTTPSSTNQFITRKDFQKNAERYAITTGSSNAYVAGFTPAITALVDGMIFNLKSNFANTATATLNIDTLGAKTLKKYADSALANLAANDILSAQDFTVMYQSSSDTFILQSPGATALNTIPYAQQRINISTGVTNGVRGTATAPVTGFGPGVSMYLSSGDAANPLIRAFRMDALTGLIYPYSAGASLVVGNNTGSVVYKAVLGSYVYFSQNENGTGVWKLSRFDADTLANGVVMTISGGGPAASVCPIASDATYLYIYTSGNTLKRYTVSGTTATFDSNVTFTSIDAAAPMWTNGTNLYQCGSTSIGAIGKWPIAGGAKTSVTIPDFQGLTAGYDFGLIGLVGGTKQARIMSQNDGTAYSVYFNPITAV